MELTYRLVLFHPHTDYSPSSASSLGRPPSSWRRSARPPRRWSPRR